MIAAALALRRVRELYTDYLISSSGFATATGLSGMLDGEISHDQVTHFLSERAYTSKDLWREVKSTVRKMEKAEGVLIFDDSSRAGFPPPRVKPTRWESARGAGGSATQEQLPEQWKSRTEQHKFKAYPAWVVARRV